MPDTAEAWTRGDWVGLADRILVSAQRFASPGHARITLPGPEGGYGRSVDGLEGFARTFLLAGFRLAGERGAGLEELAEWYARGLATGTDPASPERWVRLDEHPQAKVEAASLALVLDLTRPWIWDRLSPDVQERVVEYLSPAIGDPTYPRINWVWFRLLVQTFLRSVGGPWSATDVAEDLETHESFRRAGGWLSDGPTRAYDHYVGWALHVYPILWARMAGAADLATGFWDREVESLDRFLNDAVALVGADGSPLIQGRSLIYRFAAAAPFWAGALARVPSVPAGLLRHAATSVVRHFVERGAPDERGLLSLGWHGPWPRLAQSYSGPGSPYWASKGLLGLALPAGHPVWTEPALPLPVETGDVLRAVRAPGWLIAGTRADGIVRVINHGTDHATEGSTATDSPLYARLGYSTATAPVLDESGWTAPEDQSAVLIDGAGRHTHRTGMRTLTVRVEGDGPDRVGVAGSSALTHWVEVGPAGSDHGYGRAGEVRQAGHVTVFSLARGPWELRLVRVDDLGGGVDPAALRLRIGGWPVAGDGAADISQTAAIVTGARLTSRVQSVLGTSTAGITEHDDAGPLGRPVRVPWLDHAVHVGLWVAALVELSAEKQATDHRPRRIAVDVLDAADTVDAAATADTVDAAATIVRIDWPDGLRTRTRIETHASRENGGNSWSALRR